MELNTKLLRDLAGLFQPESLSEFLEQANSIDWDVVQESWAYCVQNKELAIFVKEREYRAEAFPDNPENQTDQHFVDRLTQVFGTPFCEEGRQYVVALEEETFFAHTKECEQCLETKKCMGWYPLMVVLDYQKYDLNKRASKLLGEPREINTLNWVGLKIGRDRFERVPGWDYRPYPCTT